MTTYETEAEAYAMAEWLAAEHFAQQHPERYRRMGDGVFHGYYGKPVGGYLKLQAALDRQAAIADGFPSFSRWLSTRTPAQEAAAA